jgi:glyoxylase-like metal-dependent hydrolase (beta-lactamase superfamily II)
MTQALGAIQWQAWRDRVLPPVEELDGGVWSIPVPIPDNPLRYTLSYAISSSAGLVLVDPGWDSAAGRTALTDGLAQAGATLTGVVGVVATHVHPDHHGLSAHVREASGAWIAMHPAERDTLASPVDAAQRPARVAAWLRNAGMPEDELEQLVPVFGLEPTFKLVEPDLLLDDGDRLPLPDRHIRTLWTPGHTPGHICLIDEDHDALLTGDHLLPYISPHIGVQPSTDSPLGPYLNSLQRLVELDELAAYPAHEYRFRGIAERVVTLLAHHEERCVELLAVVKELGAATAWEIAERLTWSRPWAEIGFMRVAATAETVAHIEYLVQRGDLGWGCGQPVEVILAEG